MNTLTNNERDDINEIIRIGARIGYEKVVAVGNMVADSQKLTKDELKSVFGGITNGRRAEGV